MTSIADIIRVKAEQKALDFKCDIPAGLPDAVMVDEKRLRQALLNLLGNAVKFTRRGAVTLQLSVLERDIEDIVVRFAVEDTGTGIAAGEIERIFLAFEQAGSPADQAAGTGLGLPISRQLVQLMGSELKVRSQLGSGSLFWFDLDLDIALALEPSVPVRQAGIAGYLGSRRKVLIVDDVEANRAIAVGMLASLGFETSEASDGNAAVAQALADPPDLVLMDSVMPGLDGLGATLRLRQAPRTRDVPVIVMSASTSHADKHKALDTGANAFLAKPLAFDLLLQEIARLLDLTWVLAPSDPHEPVEQDADAPLVVPPANEIEVLYRLAKVGNMRDIRERAAPVATLGAEYRPFAERLRRLADGCQSRAILQLVSQGRPDMR
jgi:CheY-like chemotaxis protein/anti-sigma regulatory factor (Ser/Thr protein kinase)